MSDCYALQPGGASSPGNGFVAGTWRSRFLQLAQDNVFFLLGCRRDSPIFQLGFPDGNSGGICRNVSGMGCEDYYRCPGWDATLAAPAGSKSTARTWARSADSAYGMPSNTPECCSLPGGAIREINLTLLRCAAYSSAYTLAPLRPRGPGAWSYGILASYSLPLDHEVACRACQASGGACGYDSSLPEADGAVYGNRNSHLCLCGDGLLGIDAWNSTSTCDFPGSSDSFSHASILNIIIGGLLFYVGTYLLVFHVFDNDKP
ncbi:hypothetical protein HPP92_013444 [Vanilla planifolia]|uniref:Uncharacterized protein n=1 Tax=Vanilla planifolia TaxID=51239 RepID=A0A835UWN9_VANPL|nr:hypothetical protein HPP92_013444 [Vanilla planifolia]